MQLKRKAAVLLRATLGVSIIASSIISIC